MYQSYLHSLGSIPKFLEKYLQVPSLVRLKKVCYFCGMDYASKEIYDFKEHISRFDHSLSVAMLVYKLTKNKVETIAALFHDVATPCFSHAIDYMNKDYETQESTEEYTEIILKNDKKLISCLKKDKIAIEDIIDYKKYSVVDNKRPKVCADRMDGVILTGMLWTKDLNEEMMKKIVKDLKVFENEDGSKEIGFKSLDIAQLVYAVSKNIDKFCHSKEDNYMMELLASICARAISKKLFSYEELYYLTEDKIWILLDKSNDQKLKKMINKFRNIKKEEIEELTLPYIKIRNLNPLVNGKRLKS